MGADVWIFGISVAAFFLVGLPVIRATIFIPARMDFQEIPAEQLTPAQKTFFDKHDAALSALGYQPLCAFKAANLQGPNVNRLYANGAGPGICLVTAMTSADGGVSTSYAEFIDVYTDGSRLTTKNAEVSAVFLTEPDHLIQDMPGAAIEELKARHDQKARELARAPIAQGSKDEIFRRANDYHGKFCEFQRSKGLLRLDGEVYRATYFTGLFGIWNFLNPFADNFTWKNLALGLGGGVGLPALASLNAVPWSLAAARAWGVDPALTALSIVAGAYLLGGAVIGLVFSAKGFLWSFLLGWGTAKLLPPTPLGHSVLGLIMAVGGELGSRIRNRLVRLA